MTPKAPPRKSPSTKARADRKQSYTALLRAIESAHARMVGSAALVVNKALVLRNWLVGAHIVEYEQGGSDRALYGAALVKRLAADLASRGLRSLNLTALKLCRLCYQAYPQIGPTLSDQFTGARWPRRIRPTVSGELAPVRRSGRSAATEHPPLLPAEQVLRLSWSQLVELLAIGDPWKRAFFENECLRGRWSVRQLRRQIESLLYERTGLSSDKRAVIQQARRQALGAPTETVGELIRDPYVLEFVGLAERATYSESDLEGALLDHLQRFLLELGTGFCFEARQFRITVNRKHDRVDLVFYHRRLRCHVLLDLKIRAFRHADAGQMNFYVNWFKANMMAKGDQPPVGIILCSEKDRTEVEFATAGMNNRLFVSRYLTALPSADVLKALVEQDRARLEAPGAPRGKNTK